MMLMEMMMLMLMRDDDDLAKVPTMPLSVLFPCANVEQNAQQPIVGL